jgi:hypothetical protein
LHSSGKKASFAQYVKGVRDEMLQVVNTYQSTYDAKQLYSVMKKSFNVDFALERIAEYTEVIGVAEIVKNVFAGVETQYERSFGPVSTDCHGTSPLSPPLHTLFSCYLSFKSELTLQYVK